VPLHCASSCTAPDLFESRAKEGLNEVEFYRQALSVMAFLGGVAFAALVIVLQSPSIFQVKGLIYTSARQHFQNLITALALGSLLFLIGSFACVIAISAHPAPKLVGLIASWSYVLGSIILLFGISVLLEPYTVLGSLAVLAITAPLFGYLLYILVPRKILI
jgi:hypothetical protein